MLQTIATPDVRGFIQPAKRRTAGMRLWSITASLVAARREADDSITLVLCDPVGRPHRMLVSLPSPGEDACAADPVLCARMAAARAAFVQAMLQPSYEGFTLLYGTARLTLALHQRGTQAGAQTMPHVLDFSVLEDGQPSSDSRRAA